MTLADPSGLLSNTNYYFFANGKEYRVYTGALTPTFEQVILLMDLEVRRDDLTVFAVGVAPNQDIRFVDVSTSGSGSSVRLASGVSGLDLFASLNGFTDFDPPVEGLDVDIQSLIATAIPAPILLSSSAELEIESLYTAVGGPITKGITTISIQPTATPPDFIYLTSSNVNFYGESEFEVDRTIEVAIASIFVAGSSDVDVSINAIGQAGAVFAGAATTEIADAFITSWRTDDVVFSTTSTNQIKLPLDSDGTYNFTVDWGDGSSDSITAYDQPEVTHTYGSVGTYTISIVGICDGFGFKAAGEDNSKLLDIQQWGQVKLHDKGSQFYSCLGLTSISAIDEPDLSANTRLTRAFQNSENLIGGVSGWDTSNIKFLNYMFSGCTSFDDDLSAWNTTSATNINNMFESCSNFNSNLPWSTSNLATMCSVFKDCSSFNGNISDWTTTSVINMRSMFENCSAFNVDISAWNVSGVENMSSMFSGCSSFNQDIGSWNVSGVVTMQSMFNGATAFNQDLNLWITSSVADMSFMFRAATSFDGDITTWDVSSVTTMESMFEDAAAFNQDISAWDISSVTNFGIFTGTSISTSNYSKMLIEWPKLPSLQTSVGLFIEQTQFLPEALTGKIDLIRNYNWNIQDDGVSDTTVFVSKWQTDATGTTTSATNQIKLPLDSDGTYNFTVDWGDGSSDSITAYDQPEVTHTYSSDGIYAITINGQCDGFGFAATGEDNSKLLNVYQWGSVTFHDNGGQFQSCNNLEFFDANDTPDLSATTNASRMFFDCVDFIGAVDNWDTASIINMQSMFENCTSFDGDINGWITASVTDMSFMFKNATSFNSNVNNWDVSSVTTMESMFENASSFDSQMRSWYVVSVTNMTNMLVGSGISIANYSSALVPWSLQSVQSNVTLDAGDIKYNAEAAVPRQILIDDYSWTINDGGEVVGSLLSDGSSETEFEIIRTATVTAMLFGGTAMTTKDLSYEASGELLFSGSAEYTFSINYVGEGIHILASTSPFEIDVIYSSTGGILVSGFATKAILENVYLSSVQLVLTSGDSTVNFVIEREGSGTLLVAGESLGTTEFTTTASGEVTAGGAADSTIVIERTAEGEAVISGAIPDITIEHIATVSGEITASGEAEYTLDAAAPASEFIMTVETTSDNEDFVLPTGSGTFDYTVDWGDGNVENNQTGSKTHTYATAGTYDVKISGTFPHMNQGTSGNTPEKIVDIKQWGAIVWGRMQYMLSRTSINSYSATDVPDLSSVTDMNGMFYQVTLPDGFDISTWDTSSVTNMYGVFSSATLPAGFDISTWDTSSVTDMMYMFNNATLPDGFDISTWDTSSVTNMDQMFFAATLPDPFDLSGWCVTNIASEPANFGTFNGTTQLKPVWGTCP